MAKYAEVAPKILNFLEQGMSNRDAVEKAGLTEETFYKWLREKTEFSEAVHKAKEIGDQRAINEVERSLLDLAKGFEYEEVRTEYESRLNEKTGKYEPTIKKQVRTKKQVIPSTEAIKFYLTNKAPEEWKNRLEQNNTGTLATDLRVNFVSGKGDEDFPSSENEVDAVRENV